MVLLVSLVDRQDQMMLCFMNKTNDFVTFKRNRVFPDINISSGMILES